MDTSSELVHRLLPVFMASVLGASMLTIGVVEGVAEATVSVTKVFSGALRRSSRTVSGPRVPAGRAQPRLPGSRAFDSGSVSEEIK
jgi:hypothetical protein